jgi:hypothetical protein
LKLEPAGGGTTVHLAEYGFGEGGKWDESFAYFQKAWAMVLDNLEKYCAERPGR